LEKVRFDNRAPGRSRRTALLRLKKARGAFCSGNEFALEWGECGWVGFGPSANDHINGINPLQDVQADDLPESSLQPISLHNRATMLRNDEAYAGMMQKGSDYPELEMLEPNPLPFA
jgi:hypothetical protein